MSPREDADGSAVPRETQRVANRSAARVRGDPRLRALRPMPRARRRFTSLGQTVARRLVVGRAGPVDARRARPNADITTWATPARGRPGAYATHPDRRVSPPTAAPRYPASHVRPPAPVGGVALGERRVHPVRPSSPWARGGTTPRRAVQVSPWTAVAADSRDSVARPRSAEEGAALPAARVRRRAQDRPALRRAVRCTPPAPRFRSLPTRRVFPEYRGLRRRQGSGDSPRGQGGPPPQRDDRASGSRRTAPHRAPLRAARRTSASPPDRWDGSRSLSGHCPEIPSRRWTHAPAARPRPGRAPGTSTPEPTTGHPTTRPQGPGRPAASPVARRPSDSPSANDSRRCSDAPSFNSAWASGSRLSSPTNEPARRSVRRSGDGPAARPGRPIPSGRGLTVAVHGEPAPARPRRGLAPRPVISVAGEWG